MTKERIYVLLLPLFNLFFAEGANTYCPQQMKAIFADIHDGDQKEVSIKGLKLTVRPAGGSNLTWIVDADLDREDCSAMVDFNVPGKEEHPPIPLKAKFYFAGSHDGKRRLEMEFTDPTGTIATKKSLPLNRWVSLSHDIPVPDDLRSRINKKLDIFNLIPCVDCLSWTHAKRSIFLDLQHGDKKEVVVNCTSITIKPLDKKQSWETQSPIDEKTCSSVINFKVPGNHDAPPVKLLATLLHTGSLHKSDHRFEYEFTDPSGTMAPADFPLNHWVELDTGDHKQIRSHHKLI
jgi:hypothetical protein